MSFYIVFVCSMLVVSASFALVATEFTVSSYNCGGLTEHYDYLRAATMQSLMQQRHNAEPEKMALNEKIQKVALKILFGKNSQESALAQQEWDHEGYQQILEQLVKNPNEESSANAIWNTKAEEMITPYNIRPIILHDKEVSEVLQEHISDLTRGRSTADTMESLKQARAVMAQRIFSHYLKHDIICLQEADYLDAAMFPDNYEVIFSNTQHSVNGIAWNKERFKLLETVGKIMGRAYAVKLQDNETGKTLLVASGHITGCNPFQVDIDPKTGIADSAKGDNELKGVVELFDGLNADFKVIGMDSNVTSLHPRLNILKAAGYQLDAENYLEPTCTNPYQVLNTRIDWISLKSKSATPASIVNIPVMSVSLNNIHVNMSDHKPIAAKVSY